MDFWYKKALHLTILLGFFEQKIFLKLLQIHCFMPSLNLFSDLIYRAQFERYFNCTKTKKIKKSSNDPPKKINKKISKEKMDVDLFLGALLHGIRK